MAVAAFLAVGGFAVAQTPPQPAAPAEEADQIHPPPKIEWEKIADLPPRPGFDKQPGLAGTFAGAQGDVLLIAGGTNYPVGEPWNEAKRASWSDIYVLKRSFSQDTGFTYQWLPPGLELPRALAYGASVSLTDGVLCIGGAEMSAVRDECFLLKWNEAAQKVELEDFPKLPKPLACLRGVRVKDTVYVFGGTGTMPNGPATNSFYALDLTKRGNSAEFVWKALPPWDGPGRVFPIAATSLENGVEGIYLCGGRDTGNDPDFLTDLHKYNPDKKDWSILGNILDPRGHPAAVMGAPAFHVPPHHLIIVSGTDEDLTRLLENNSRKLEMLDDKEKAAREAFNLKLLEAYPGYTRAVMAYDAQAGEWTHIGAFPGAACLTTPTVNWDGAIVIPGGETGPGRRSAEIWQASVRKKATVVE